jgi:ERF superfamily
VTTSEQINEIAAALAAAQSNFPVLVKDSRAEIRSPKGDREYRYVSLGKMLEAVQPHLAAQGICCTQPLDSDEQGSYVVTLLLHRSGQWIASRLRIPLLDDPQALGSFISYARRYSLASVTGLAIEDDDGQAARPRAQGSRRGPPAAPAPREPGSDDDRRTVPKIQDGPWLKGAAARAGSTSVFQEIGRELGFDEQIELWTAAQVRAAIAFRKEVGNR